MVDGTRNDDQDRRQALEDLVSSPGWRIFADEARRAHGPEALAQDLLSLARETNDLLTIGAMTSARLSVLHAMDQLIAWPQAILDQYQTASGDRE